MVMAEDGEATVQVGELLKQVRDLRETPERAKATNVALRLERFSPGTEVEFRGELDERTLMNAPVLIAMKEDGSAVVILPE